MTDISPAEIARLHPKLVAPMAGSPNIADWVGFEDERVVIRTGKVEIGQGIWSALRLIAAEELDVAPERIDVQAGDTRACPDEGLTSSSLSVETSGNFVRLAASAARKLLTEAAAARLGAPADALSVVEGRFHHSGAGTPHSYWSLAPAVDLDQPAAAHAQPKPREAYRQVGHAGPRDDIAAKVSGAAFIQDLELPGLRHVRTVRAPHPLARPEPPQDSVLSDLLPPSADFLREGGFLAVIADTEAEAVRLGARLEALTAWRAPPPRHADPFEELESSPAPWETVLESGAPPAPPPADVDVTLTRRFLAHGSIATSCGLAWRQGDQLTVWTHSQAVYLLANAIGRLLGLEPHQLHVIFAPSAGCYGHNGADDAAAEAALVAWRRPGRPVRLVWSRAQELTTPLGAPMRTRVRLSLDGDKRVQDLELDVQSGSHARRPGLLGGVNLQVADLRDGAANDRVIDPPLLLGGGGDRNAEPAYATQGLRVRKKLITDLSIKTSSLRSLGAFLNVAAIEAAMDEAAALAGADPVAFRLAHLEDPRARTVVARTAEMAGWPGPPDGGGRALGFGYSRYKNKAGYCAVAVEVELSDEVRLLKAWSAVDVGLAVDPDGVSAQVEGGVIQALSWAVREEVRFEDGCVSSLDWEAYPILRFGEIPEVAVEVIQHLDAPTLGAGEIAQGPAAAAVGNAVARALGMRICDFPLTRERLIQALAS